MAVKTIIIRNMAGRDQTFQVNGWNVNKRVVVKGHSEHRIAAADGSSGAIIAIYDNEVAEQAEITKHGYMGNDFIDMSNICGAGGNMIVQQVGDNHTRKGHPRFMQAFNNAYAEANQGTKDGLKNCVIIRNGKVVRIRAPKDFPNLEKFVRSFADGMTYIGVGAWGGSPGVDSDNKQSSAGKGSKDTLVCYNDMNGDATPKQGPKGHVMLFAASENGSAEASTEADGQAETSEILKIVEPAHAIGDTKAQVEALLAAAGGDPSKIDPAALAALMQSGGEPTESTEGTSEDAATPFTTFAVKDPGPGIHLTNKSSREAEYFFYDNYWNGNGTAGANFDKPLKSVKLKPNQSVHVPLPTTFKGRLQRGKDLPCTWVEFQLDASNDHAAHGDISLQQGCDGAATIASTDGSNQINGFSHEIVKGAPEKAIRKKPNGERAIDTTVGNWNGGPNQAAIDYLNKVVGQRRAYILGGTGVPDVKSKNKRMAVVMYN